MKDAEAQAHLSTIRFGSKPWRWDPRERGFSHDRYFGAPNVSQLPREGLKRSRRPAENQWMTLRCGAYATAVSNGYIRKLRFHPDWQAKKIGQKQGRNVDINGSEPRACMNSMRDDGSLLYDLAPVSLEKDGVERSGQWSAYPDNLDRNAKSYRVTGYLGVDDKYDYFDDVRWALYRAYDRVKDAGPVVHAFSQWYYEWTSPPNGIVPATYTNFAGYHAYLFIDWVEIDGVPYLVAQNSAGDQYGDKGFVYFPREVVNHEFAKWGTALKIPTGALTPEMIELAKQETIAGYIQRMILQAWYLLSEKFGLYA